MGPVLAHLFDLWVKLCLKSPVEVKLNSIENDKIDWAQKLKDSIKIVIQLSTLWLKEDNS